MTFKLLKEQKNSYKSFLEQQMYEKNQEKDRKKELYSSQAEYNQKKIEEYKEFQKQETQRKREEQMRYREFLNIQVIFFILLFFFLNDLIFF